MLLEHVLVPGAPWVCHAPKFDDESGCAYQDYHDEHEVVLGRL